MMNDNAWKGGEKHWFYNYSQTCFHNYSQTCFTDHLHLFVSLEYGFSVKHVLKEPVFKDRLCFPWVAAIDRFDCTTIVTPVTLVRHMLNK